jgi:hypothetical protein
LPFFFLLEFKLDPLDTLWDDTVWDGALWDGPVSTRRQTSEHFWAGGRGVHHVILIESVAVVVVVGCGNIVVMVVNVIVVVVLGARLQKRLRVGTARIGIVGDVSKE